ncbi:response regulator containing a CheY-like receiver domain and an HTH DNA-binding domain [Bradyrhizobium sp. YR681]|uniref:helix-turn-helix transcriptional regulator n=1 Tax=Bradyrhizobium sp. YR681 TaxID=1144344 RepID=UPI00026FB1A3|nr:helix-turn-helix transcriptional regulator [Bradyrhizobium sp. YR681]EJN07598.1 response regulator containing a CheY-like receiver domain and an HTH DNA-binding domain [Bradyrhizobium sp. YR681]
MNVVTCRALAAARAPDPEAADAAAFADTLDGLDAGLFLVDADGRLIHANVAGRAVLETCNVLLEIRGQLMACDPIVSQTLRRVFAACGLGDSALGAAGIALPMVGLDGQRHVAHVLPLTSGPRRRAGAGYSAVAALFVRKVALTISPRSEALRDAFKLTPTELRVLLAIVELGGVPEVAAALGVATTTIRTHVRRLFEKTGTARQADFVKLVAGYATPLRDIGGSQ